MSRQITVLPFAEQAPLPPDQNPVLLYLGSVSPGSRETLQRSLQVMVNLFSGTEDEIRPLRFPWWKIRYPHAMAARALLTERYAPRTVNKILAALRQVLRHCQRLGLMSAEDCLRACDLPRAKGTRLPAGRMLTEKEFRRLLKHVRKHPVLGSRDQALLLVLGLGGLRRQEVSNLEVRDFDRTQKTLRIHGKGNKDRELPVSTALQQALKTWLKDRGKASGPLFCRAIKGPSFLVQEGLTPRGVHWIVQRAAQQARIVGISPHDFRRTFISALLDHGEDLVTVSKLVGHASVSTTSQYDRRGEKAKRRAVETLNHLAGRPLGAVEKGGSPDASKKGSFQRAGGVR